MLDSVDSSTVLNVDECGVGVREAILVHPFQNREFDYRCCWIGNSNQRAHVLCYYWTISYLSIVAVDVAVAAVIVDG